MEKVKDQVKGQAAGMADEAKQRGKERLEQGKDTAASQAEQLASAVDRAAEELQGQNPSLANYAGQLADSMNRLAENLRDRSINDLASDTQQLARRNPALFMLGSVALGVALSRFLKASAERPHGAEYSSDYSSSGYGSADYTARSSSSLGDAQATGYSTVETASGSQVTARPGLEEQTPGLDSSSPRTYGTNPGGSASTSGRSSTYGSEH